MSLLQGPFCPTWWCRCPERPGWASVDSGHRLCTWGRGCSGAFPSPRPPRQAPPTQQTRSSAGPERGEVRGRPLQTLIAAGAGFRMEKLASREVLVHTGFFFRVRTSKMSRSQPCRAAGADVPVTAVGAECHPCWGSSTRTHHHRRGRAPAPSSAVLAARGSELSPSPPRQ